MVIGVMTVMTEVQTRRAVHTEQYKLLRTIWRRTLSFKKKKSEDRFAGYKGVRDITIKKGPSGLGLMIIEGRHAEAGRGIFVSDLQEGSAAEQAGLQIGDMILAVNRDSLLRCSYDAAAAKLKHTEGVVKLTVCTPNLKDKKEDAPSAEETGSAATSVPAGSTASHPASGNQTPDPGLTAAGSSRPHSPRPAPSPVRTEPPADPATAPIVPNQETVIEIATDSQNLGLFLLGGSDTSINGPAAVVLDVVKDRPVGRDGRLQHGDQIRAACGISLTDAMTEDRLNMTIKQWAPKLKFTVFRPDPIPYVTIEVDINRKQKPLGFSFAAFSNDKGVYIAQILPGSPTEQDGRLKRGDHILTVDGKDISGMDFTSASIALKLLGPKVSIKVRRLKIVR